MPEGCPFDREIEWSYFSNQWSSTMRDFFNTDTSMVELSAFPKGREYAVHMSTHNDQLMSLLSVYTIRQEQDENAFANYIQSFTDRWLYALEHDVGETQHAYLFKASFMKGGQLGKC